MTYMIVFVFPGKTFLVYIWFTGGKYWSWEFGFTTFCFGRSANSVSTYIIHSLCRFTSTSFTSYMTDYTFLFSLCLVVYIPFISLEILDWEFGKLLPDYLTKWKMFWVMLVNACCSSPPCYLSLLSMHLC